jgi:hypothetical protein
MVVPPWIAMLTVPTGIVTLAVTPPPVGSITEEPMSNEEASREGSLTLEGIVMVEGLVLASVTTTWVETVLSTVLEVSDT